MNKIIDVAAGRIPADIVFKNAKIVDVYNNQIILGNLAICGDRIAVVGEYAGKVEIDLKGKIICPSFVDAHLHIESSMVLPVQYAQEALLTGTTTFICDPHEIVNVCGPKGLKMMIENSKNLPCDFKFVVPSCVPATEFETNGYKLTAKETKKLLRKKNIFGLGEMMNYVGIAANNKEVVEKVNYAHKFNKNVDGHAPLMKGKELNAYISAGIYTEHECEEPQEMEEKISKGMYILLRHGSASVAVSDLTPYIKPHMIRRILFCSDDKSARKIKKEGGINKNIKVAIENGMDPIDAVTIASLNACECYGLKQRGAIVPGYFANLTIIDSFEKFNIDSVYYMGKQIVSKGKLTVGIPANFKCLVHQKVKFPPILPEKLNINLASDKARVIQVIPNELVTQNVICKVNVKDGLFVATEDINKIMVVERYGKNGNIGVALVKGFGIKNGAMAQTIAHDSHNVICIGDNDSDMIMACNRLKRLNGGVVVVSKGKIMSELKLEIGGLMTTAPLEYVISEISSINNALYKMGVGKLNTKLSFLALAVIPSLKITDKGLFNSDNFSFTNVDPTKDKIS